MDKRLVNTLLRVFHSQEQRFAGSKGLMAFCNTYNVGRAHGASWVFTEQDKAEIGKTLKGVLGIDADQTLPGSWDGLTRSGSLTLARDEKLARKAVGAGRLLVKSLQGQVLAICGGEWLLPERADLGVDLDCLMSSSVGHDSILVVENRLTFQDLWQVRFEMLEGRGGQHPLVVFRGDADCGSRADAVNQLILSLGLPVYAFVDFDPAGMVIAASLPRLDGLVAPSRPTLSKLLEDRGLSERFAAQLSAARHVLERIESAPTIGPIWKVICDSGKALPQEYFHRT